MSRKWSETLNKPKLIQDTRLINMAMNALQQFSKCLDFWESRGAAGAQSWEPPRMMTSLVILVTFVYSWADRDEDINLSINVCVRVIVVTVDSLVQLQPSNYFQTENLSLVC